jgi:hypothetical protein
LLVIFPSSKRAHDIVLLPLFRFAAEKDDNFFAVFSKINPVAGAEMNPAFKNTGPNTLNVGEIAQA